MAERDTYQLVLQLKDELTSNLKTIQGQLTQTVKVGKETSDTVKSFTTRIKDSITPLRNFASTVRNAMAFGGVAILIRGVAKELGDMEKAYAKLHPESQKAAGSLQSWNDAMTNMRASGGEVVATLLGPIREAFIKMLDPVGSATRALREYKTELDKLVDTYKSEATKKAEDYAKMMLTLKNAQQDYVRQVQRQIAYEKELVSAREWLAYVSDPKRVGMPGGAEAMQRAKVEVEVLEERLKTLKITIAQNRTLMGEIPQILREQAEKTDTVAKKTNEITDAEKLMNTYLKENVGLQQMRLEAAQEYMDAWDEVYANSGYREGTKIGAGGAAVTPKPEEFYQRNQYSLEQEAKILAEINRQLIEYYGYKNIIETPLAKMAEDFRVARLDLLQNAIIGVADALGQVAAGTKSFSDAMADMVRSILQTLGPLMIQKGLELLTSNLALGLSLIAAGGLTLVGAGMVKTYPNQGIANPAAMASGGIVNEPTLALLGEAGPEAVVPLNPYRRGAGGGYGSIGGVTIVAPNAQFLDGRIAAQLVRQGLSAMRS